MIYEIINPSDPYTLECDRFDVATAAIFLLGNGRLSLRGDDEAHCSPLCLFGGMREWFVERFGEELEPFIEGNMVALAIALDSVLIGDAHDRRDYYKALALITDLENRVKWRDGYLDRRRSSMNNIGGAAYRLAAQLREAADRAKAVPA